ncbi:hypothetical protein PHAVU_011G007701 [Phaseolus vulgaris]|uniref:RALF-like protein n=1 Tax=Phaseolus vulgaris TaxID=3885 RepID=V7AH16_PHAVU|nr:hypothetical protein PHAVU_011G007700g [Phaseolus vulgaris]ESW03361.1 hypothetical protein PHAVU_011G007700g [Phaseolus vulgaris]
MASKTNICLLLFLSFIFIFSAKTISATNNLALASASEQNAGEMSESRKLLGTGREQRPKCKGKKSTQDHSKDKPQCHNYL